MGKMELLAPAGSMDKMKMAFLYGADAVYLGGKSFGLRAFSDNFSNEELKEAVDYAHARGKHVHVTVNIFPRLPARYRRRRHPHRRPGHLRPGPAARA
jgi:putative protease